MDVDTVVGLKPDAMVVDDADDGDVYFEQSRCHGRKVVERPVRRRIKNIVAANGIQPRCFCHGKARPVVQTGEVWSHLVNYKK
jgi:hypothetical protein